MYLGFIITARASIEGFDHKHKYFGERLYNTKTHWKPTTEYLMDDYDAVAASFPWREFVLFRIIDKSENAVQANHHRNV